MEFTPKPCPDSDCNGQVNLHAFGAELHNAIAKGQCNTCGQHFECELTVEPEGDLLPVEPILNPSKW